MRIANKQTARNGKGRRDRRGRFTPGHAGGPGRPKGRQNRINALLKDDIEEAYRLRGGVNWLRRLKDRDFVRLLEKIMPRELAADLRLRAQGPPPISVTVYLTGEDETKALPAEADQALPLPAAKKLLPGPEPTS